MAVATRQALPFTKITATSGIRVTVRIGPAQPLEVRAQANILPLIATDVAGGALSVRSTADFDTSDGVEVVIVAPSLDAIVLNGGSQGQVMDLAAQRFEIQLNGGSSLTASGTSVDVSLTSTGGSTANLADLGATRLSMALSGGAEVDVNVSDEVTGTASGGAQATVSAPASISVVTSGGAEVTRR